MTLPNDACEEQLKQQLKELQRHYSKGLKILQCTTGKYAQLNCVEQLIPIIAAVQKLEVAAALSSPLVKARIKASDELSRMALEQRQLLKQLLAAVKKVEGEFQSQRKTTSQELDQQFEHQKMQTAYQKKQ